MPDIDVLRKLLTDRNLTAVSRETGVSPHALYRFRRGSTPSYRTVERLVEYLRQQPRVAADG